MTEVKIIQKTSSLARKSCLYFHLLYCSRCLPFERPILGFERGCSAGIAAYRGEGAWLFRPYEKIAARGFPLACFALANVAKPVLQGIQVCTI